MKILFCGSSGFLGRHIVKHISGVHTISPFNFSEGHDMTNARSVMRAAAGHDIIFHFGASAVGRRHAIEIGSIETSSEMIGMRNFIVAAKKYVIPIVYASSIRVYGSTEEMQVGESVDCHPTSLYGELKYACEQVLRASGVDHCILRMSAAYGSGMPDDFVFAEILRKIMANKPIILKSVGEAKRNFISVNDVADAVGAFLNHLPNVVGEALNIIGPESVTLPELADIIGSVAGKPVSLTRGISADDISEEELSGLKAERVIEWHAKVYLRDGLAQLVSEYESNE